MTAWCPRTLLIRQALWQLQGGWWNAGLSANGPQKGVNSAQFNNLSWENSASTQSGLVCTHSPYPYYAVFKSATRINAIRTTGVSLDAIIQYIGSFDSDTYQSLPMYRTASRGPYDAGGCEWLDGIIPSKLVESAVNMFHRSLVIKVTYVAIKLTRSNICETGIHQRLQRPHYCDEQRSGGC